jgi:hypothetical protein
MLVNDILKLLMDDWLIDLVDMLLMDDWLMVLVDDGLMVLVNNVLMHFSDHVLVDLMDNVLVVLLHKRLLHMFLDYGCLLVLHISCFFLNDCNPWGFLVLDHYGLLVNPSYKGGEGTVLAGAVLKSVATSSAQKRFLQLLVHNV